MGFLDALGRLIQLGGIGGSLTFLYLGYTLLREELSRKTASGNSSAPRAPVIKTIKSFIGVSLIFFIVGVFAELALSGKVFMMIEMMRDHIKEEVSRARLVHWEFDPKTGNIEFKLAATRYDQDAYVPNSILGNYKIVVAVREDSSTPDDAGSYPIFFGPYSFPNAEQSDVNEPLKPEKAKLISQKCVKMVVFGVPANTPLPSEGDFKPSAYGGMAKVFSWQTGGPDGTHC